MPASRDSQDDHNHEKQKWEGGKKDFSCPEAEKDWHAIFMENSFRTDCAR